MSQSRHAFVNDECFHACVTTPEGAPIARSRRHKRRSSARLTMPETRPPRLMLARLRFWHRAAEWLLHVLAVSAVVAIVLILVFIAKEAAPMLYSKVVREEVTLAKMWWPQLWPGLRRGGVDLAAGLGDPEVRALAADPRHAQGDASSRWRWRCRSASGAAVYVSQYARPRVARDRQARRRAAGGNSVGGARLLRADGDGDLVPEPVRHLESRLNALVSGVALSFAVIPVIFTLSEEALRRRAAQLRRGVDRARRRALADDRCA